MIKGKWIIIISLIYISNIFNNQNVYNLNVPLKYENFHVFFNFISQSELFLQKENDYSLKIESDLGTISLDNDIFKINKVIFKSKNVIKINDYKFPLEMDIVGFLHKNDKKYNLKFSIIFEKSQKNNLFLYNLGFGKGDIKKMCNSCNKKIDFNFNLEDLIKGYKYFIKYEEDENVQIILYETLDISENQINELKKFSNDQIKDIPKKLQIFQNKLKNDSFIEIKKKSIIRKDSKGYIILDDYLEKPRFFNKKKYESIKKIYLKNLKKTNKKKDKKNKEKIKNPQYKTVKEQNKLIYTPFEIYSPPEGFPWGYIYKDAIMPWEQVLINNRKDIEIKNFDLPSPIKNYKYIPFFYYKTRNNYKDNGKYIYVPYLILVNKNMSKWNLPLSIIKIYNPSNNKEHKIKIIRDFNGKLKKNKKKVINEILKNLSKNRKKKVKTVKKIIKNIKNIKNNSKKIKNLINNNKKNNSTEIKKIITNKKKNSLKKIIKNVKKIKKNSKKIVKNLNDNSNKVIKDNLKTINFSKKPKLGGYNIKKIKADKKQNKKLAHNFLKTFDVKKKFFRRFPKLNCPIDEIPKNCLKFTKKLNNNWILNLNIPTSKIKNSKYVALLYCKLNYKFSDGRNIYTPVYYLVKDNFFFKFSKNKEDKKTYHLPKIPFIMRKSRHEFIVTPKNFKNIDIDFNDVLDNMNLNKPSKFYENRDIYITQKNFNIKVSKMQYRFDDEEVKERHKKNEIKLDNSINSLEKELNVLN